MHKHTAHMYGIYFIKSVNVCYQKWASERNACAYL